jgi:Lon protease-like protein
MAEMPMFPLGTVLFPYGVLPLHVFEDRYRALVEVCLAGDHEFGVVLIERGSEVGGGDTRFEVGTVARIVEAGRFPDGRYALLTHGAARFRVREWLPDDPYPRADVELLDEREPAGDDTRRRASVEQHLRRLLALASELGASVPASEVALDRDPVRAGFEAGALAPIGALDAQRVLEIDDPSARLDALDALLTDTASLFELRLADG